MMRQSKALAVLKSGKNVFLTGSAGAGKTYVLNQFIAYLKENKIPVAVTASTGIAATHMNGMTIHSWSGIGVREALGPKELQSLKGKKYIKDKLEKVQVLIIDEISMLHKQQLELVNMVLKFFKQNQMPFGGIQVVFCGDFFQLPPVGKPGEENRDKFAFMSQAWLEAKPTICYINEQHRQSDNSLNAILNQIREGVAGQATMDTLTSALKNNPKNKETLTRLYTHNVDVDRINQEHLLGLKSESKVFQAVVKGPDKLVELLVKSVLTDKLLELRIGTKVMFIKNNYESGYMNGTLGEVIEFTEEGFPLVRISNGNVIEAQQEDWHIEDENGKSLASFSQVPLRLAWAITVHKSQGMTLEAAEVDLSKTFEKGQGYVALSRLRDMENLFLTGFNHKALQIDSLVLKADARFRVLSSEADSKYSEEELVKFSEAFVLSAKKSVGEWLKRRKSKPDEIDELDEEDIDLRKSSKSKKKSTYELTIELIEKGYNIKQIAKERGLTETTVIGQLSKIKTLNPELNLEQLKPDQLLIDKLEFALNVLGKEVLSEKGNIMLSPLVKYFDNEYTFNEIKLAINFVDYRLSENIS